ncbi:MAG: nucleotide sugar dehydrogenase, partial [Kiritimatiellae bacterium]|nr:nucleotide sugar dehydrogenase [Kiritimatiellia bacterium]
AYWHQVIILNDAQQQRLVTRLFREMFNTLAKRKIAIFGFAFKADTGDTRESPAGAIVRMLVDEHAIVQITDPKALENARKDLADLASGVSFTADPYEAATNADAVLVTTPWAEYKTLDWRKIYSRMRHPSLVYDTHNILNGLDLPSIGFKLLSTGK